MSQQPQWSDLGTAWNAVIEFSAALVIYGGLGYLADGWLNTGHVLFFLGLLVGMVLGIYLLAKRADQAGSARPPARQSGRASR